MKFSQEILLFLERVFRGARRRARRKYFSWTLASMGEDCQICDNVFIPCPQYVAMGNRVALNEGVVLLTSNPNATITLGDDVVVSFGAKILTGGLKLDNGVDRDTHVWAKVAIGDKAWICANAVILPGVTIGRGAVVAAGSVVTRNVPSNAMVAGVPARVVKQLGVKVATGISGSGAA